MIHHYLNFFHFNPCIYTYLKKEKKKSFLKIFFLILISLFICFLTYKLCYFIAKTYFFDKFFYYKDIKYGYWIPNQKLSLTNFSDRSQDIDNLQKNIPVQVDSQKYNIAIFGDSLVWGQGVLANQRFSALLEKQLNKIRPTEIYSFNGCGDNIFDSYIKYQQSLKIYGQMNLYIFAIYNNDFVFNSDKRYNTKQFISDLTKTCKGDSIFYTEDPNEDSILLVKQSLQEETKNYCGYKKLVSLLPKNNTIYIDLGSLIEKWDVQSTFSNIISQDLNVIKPPYITNCDKNQYICHISKKDYHPSVYAHKMYSKVLFQEITNNYFK